MPSQETLERFIIRVEQNAHAEALEEFYTENCSLRENQSEPRVGRELHIANERAVFSRAKSVHSECIGPVFVKDNHVVIRWHFRFEWLDGTVTQMEELAYQRWEANGWRRNSSFTIRHNVYPRSHSDRPHGVSLAPPHKYPTRAAAELKSFKIRPDLIDADRMLISGTLHD